MPSVSQPVRETAGELGVSCLRGPWELSARLRHLGRFPLIEDNSERADGEQCLNLRGMEPRTVRVGLRYRL